MAQKDFYSEFVPAGRWEPIDRRVSAVRPKSALHWVPQSTRADDWFSIACYENEDKKLIRSVRKAFNTHRLCLSMIYLHNYDYLGSRVKDVNSLVGHLNSLEKVFEWGYRHKHFEGVMNPNPTPKDFWAFVRYMSEEDDPIRVKFVTAFTKAVNRSFADLLSNIPKDLDRPLIQV